MLRGAVYTESVACGVSNMTERSLHSVGGEVHLRGGSNCWHKCFLLPNKIFSAVGPPEQASKGLLREIIAFPTGQIEKKKRHNVDGKKNPEGCAEMGQFSLSSCLLYYFHYRVQPLSFSTWKRLSDLANFGAPTSLPSAPPTFFACKTFGM